MARKNGSEAKELIPVTTDNQLPDYLRGNEKVGLAALGREDFKVQRAKLMQATSPEVRTFVAKALPSEFWHTGANKSLGREFFATPVLVNKKVILFSPRDAGNEKSILAMSRDGLSWNVGANKEFEVKLKDNKKKVVWKTGADVKSSGLLLFGSSDPDNEESVPAATLFYEYLLYLRDFPELSPVALSAFKTGLDNARGFNTYMLSRNIPINCNVVKVFSSEETKGTNIWHVPNFEPAGNAPKEIYELTNKWKTEYAEYTAPEDDTMAEETTQLKSEDI